MKTSLVFCSALMGMTTLWAVPALAQDPPVVVETPPPAPAPAPTTVVVTNSPARATEGSPRLYPGLVWGGVALWATAYAPAAIAAAVGNDVCTADTRLCLHGREVLYIPVAGPFIAIAGVREGVGSSTLKTLLALDGAFQLGGIAMTLTGVILSAQQPPRTTTVVTAKRRGAERKVLVSPYATATSAGIGAVGRF